MVMDMIPHQDSGTSIIDPSLPSCGIKIKMLLRSYFRLNPIVFIVNYVNQGTEHLAPNKKSEANES